MKLKSYILFFLSSFFLVNTSETKACGYYEHPWEYQMMLFKAQLPGMLSLQMFNYTPDLYYNMKPDPMKNDRKANCLDWQQQVGKSVPIEDIYKILYEADPVDFFNACSSDSLEYVYAGNAFIRQLKQSKNKKLFEYLYFAKEVEDSEEYLMGGYFDSWSWNDQSSEKISFVDLKSKLLTQASASLKKAKTQFLKERYTYQVCRLAFQSENYPVAVEAYDTYFKKPDGKNLMNIWALLFKAMSVDKMGEKSEANYLYSWVFDNCDEKKLRCIQFFNRTAEVPQNISSHQKSVLHTMQIINYPGRTLDSLKTIYSLDPLISYMPFLVMREVNKLEDWILTPQYYNDNLPYSTYYLCKSLGSVYTYYYYEQQNKTTDLEYLGELKKFVVKLRNDSKEVNRDFYTIILAHLSLLEENDKDAMMYLSSVPENTDPAIQVQKNIEKAWLTMKTGDISDPVTKQMFLDKIEFLKNIKLENYDNNKILYSLTLTLSNAYQKQNDHMTGGLLKMISERFKSEWYSDDYYYGKISAFDLYAGIKDMDNLIALLQKKQKTPFETFLCDQPLGTIDTYKDLKGTIAFRNNDLQLAYETFASMSQDHWVTNYSYQSYLNEDPFFPKALDSKRSYDYQFNKTDFIKKMLDLENQIKKNKNNAAENYLKLGHAYFNCSYFGNSWMMTSYGWSSSDSYRIESDCNEKWIKDNYFTCDRAIGYYEKVLQSKATEEQKSLASLMLFECNYFKSRYLSEKPGTEKEATIKYATDFYKKYNKTSVFNAYSCSLVKEFAIL